MGDLSEHFSKIEFICRCGCGTLILNPMLVPKLEEARGYYVADVPNGRFVVNSGCRCLKHNQNQGGAPLSQHRADEELGLECSAVDLAVNGGVERYFMIRALMLAGFTGIGIAKGYIHGDIGFGGGVVRPINWLYT